jgi:alpha-mannosidase
MKTLHLIPNAHLDPVWLWDWREGLNAGITTCRTVLALMDEFPELTFIRGESAVYQHIERHDPATFRRIRRQVAAGRWEIVGGTVVQPDTNLPATETLLRQFEHGLDYFWQKFRQRPTIAWAADSFGHSAGLPEILRAAGMRGFAFSRPFAAQRALPAPAFWWEGENGARILSYRIPVGWYGSEHDALPATLDEALRIDMDHVGVFFGLGNHGGGPTRRQILDVRRWAERHPEVRVVYSGLHRFFAALRKLQNLPTYRGELNFCLRGCYASAARFKFAYRKTEAALLSAERTDAVVSAATGRKPGDLTPAWDAVLFNTFHDILPGTSIERAYDDQFAWLGRALHDSQRAELAALNALAAHVDTTVEPGGVPLLVWNPHPFAYRGRVELEAALDYRPIWQYQGRPEEVPVRVLGPDRRPVAFQSLPTESDFLRPLPWRKRVVVPVELPAFGWKVFEMAHVEGFQAQRLAPATEFAVKIGRGIEICRKGKRLVTLSALTVEDPWGSWGGLSEESGSLDLSTIRQRWKVSRVADHWVQLRAGNSRLELTFHCDETVTVAARVFWNERAARLKLVMAGAVERAEFQVPGGTVTRRACGEMPGGRWVRVPGRFGFASDALYGFDLEGGALRATICRASRYASDTKLPGDAEPWRPAVDVGELRFRFLITTDTPALPELAAQLEQPPVVLHAVPSPGKWPRAGSLKDHRGRRRIA